MSNLDSLLSSLLKDASSEELNTPLVSSGDVHSHKGEITDIFMWDAWRCGF